MAKSPPADEGLDELKEIKVKIPKALHLRIMREKILRGTGVSETAKVALESHFQGLDASLALAKASP